MIARRTFVATILIAFMWCQLVLGGAPSAVLKMLGAYSGKVASKHTKCLATVDDVAARTQFKIANHWDGKLDNYSDAARMGWVRTTTKRELYQVLRAENRYRKHVENMSIGFTTATSSSQLDEMIAKESVSEFEHWIGHLPKKDQIIVNLRQEGRSFQTIADELGLPNRQAARHQYKKLEASCPQDLRHLLPNDTMNSHMVERVQRAPTDFSARNQAMKPVNPVKKPLQHTSPEEIIIPVCVAAIYMGVWACSHKTSNKDQDTPGKVR